ncbi:MAG: hypothetical protein ACLGHZ_07250 [Actinomycetes bacterium]
MPPSARTRQGWPWRGPGPRGAWLPTLSLALVVGVLACLPLVAERAFYYWDDSAAAFAPTWRAIGLDLLSGTWPTLRPDLWMGGNWAAEAQFGLWNPVNLAGCVLVALVPHVAAAVTLVKLAVIELLALGGYALMREYGATAWVSAGVAAALPFAGFTLFFDAATWVSGLIAFAWTPWFWWAARRCARGTANPLVTYAVGYLVLTNGNPYGAIAAVVVLAGLAVEGLLTGNVAGVLRLVAVGACMGTAAGVAYLPMAVTAGVGWRGDGASFGSTGELAPDLSMLAATSSPSLLPRVDMWGQDGSTVPIAYTAWFLAPILPWLPWRLARLHARELAALVVTATAFLVVALGPSELWLFRWPIRLLPYIFLPASVLVAVLASGGLQTDGWRVRLGFSWCIVVAGGWLALAARPDLAGRHLLATGLVLALAGALGWAARRPATLPAVLAGGTAAVLACQLVWTPRNMDVNPWYFPTRVSDFQAYADRHEGPLIQVASDRLVPAEDRPAAWGDLLFGSAPTLARVESTTSYTGIGFDAFSRALCLTFSGATCAPALAAAWAPAGTDVRVPHLADAVKARSIVVQNALVLEVSTLEVPEGWQLSEASERVTVFRRVGEPPWPDSRLAAVTDGVQVASARGSATAERLRLSTPAAGGAVQFARLAWPCYTASVEGRSLEVRENAQGLIELVLPGGLADAELRLDFSPPGYPVAIPLLGAGFVGAVVHGVLWRRARKGGGTVGPWRSLPSPTRT